MKYTYRNAIVITLSQRTIKERGGGYKQIIEEWLASDGLRTWWYKVGNAPKHPDKILWVYWVVKGRIRWKCRLLEVVKNKEITFSERTKPLYAKNWLVLFDFERIPRKEQRTKKGFQGFRYIDF